MVFTSLLFFFFFFVKFIFMNEIPEVDDDLLSSIKIYNISLKKDGDSAVISFIDADDMNNKKKVEIKLSIPKEGEIKLAFKCVDGNNKPIQETTLFTQFYVEDFVFMSIFNTCFSGDINDMTEDLKKKFMLYLIYTICGALSIGSTDVNRHSSYLMAFLASHGKLSNLHENVRGMKDFSSLSYETKVNEVFILANWECFVLQSLKNFINNFEKIGFEMNDLPKKIEENVDLQNVHNSVIQDSKISLSSIFPCCKNFCDG